MRADGTGLRRLTAAPDGLDHMQPCFSPDGRFVLFASNRSRSGVQLFRVRASDGRGMRQLTSAAPGNVMPDYSPVGKPIAFVS
jgi:Tol biopolymer transport system component